MSEQTHDEPDGAAGKPLDAALPSVITPLSPEAVIGALTALSKRGKLAGFEAGESAKNPGSLFSADVFGSPFERQLLASAEWNGERTRLCFRSRLRRKMPLIYAGVFAASVWPGLPLTDSMLDTYSDWYSSHVETWWWYLPLMLLAIPGIFKLARRSRSEAHASAVEAIEKIAASVDGAVEPAESA